MRHTLLRLGVLLGLVCAGLLPPSVAYAGGGAFEANCVNLLSEQGNTRLYIQFKAILLQEAVAELQVNLMVKAAETPNILVNRYDNLSFNFLESGSRKDFRQLYNFDVEPGNYRIIVEVEDRLTGSIFYKEIPYHCADKDLSHSLSDILFLEDTAMLLRNPSVLIQDEVSGASESINFYSEIYTEVDDPLAVRAVLFRQEESFGQLQTQKFAQVGRINRILNPESSKTVFSDAFSLDELASGAYLLEIYVYREEDLVAESYRFFNIEWEDVGTVFEDLETSIRQLEYIAMDGEINEMLSIGNKKEQREAFEAWWESRQGGKVKSGKEAIEEYYKKIYQANSRFGQEGKGWKTDRGRILFFYGDPDEEQELIFKGDMYLIWTFARWEVKYIFKQQGKKFALVEK